MDYKPATHLTPAQPTLLGWILNIVLFFKWLF